MSAKINGSSVLRLVEIEATLIFTSEFLISVLYWKFTYFYSEKPEWSHKGSWSSCPLRLKPQNATRIRLKIVHC